MCRHGNAFLPFVAYATSVSLLSLVSPKHVARERQQRLGAAKKEQKRLRRTEGMTGRQRKACADAGGNSTLRVLLFHALGHCRIAVPPAEFTVR